jgi:hypothetical protein
MLCSGAGNDLLLNAKVRQIGMQIANFVVLVLTLGVLVWYAYETMRLRRAAVDQVEGMAKPCLTIFARLRDATDTILEMHSAVGWTVAQGDDGNFVVQNIGTGVALNVKYHFRPLDPSEANRPVQASYFLNVLAGQKISMPEPLNVSKYCGECEVVFQFESIGGRHYQTTVTMNNHVLTGFRLETVEA